MPAQPGVFMPPAYGLPAQPAAPAAPPIYGMPVQSSLPMPQAPAMPAPPSASLNFPATQVQQPPTASSNLVLYCILGGLFLVALFVVVFFALKG
jgi:hypothetical protein